MVRLKRVYEEPSPSDGERILVERLWPRGLTKEKAHVDTWLKEIAPSPELRRWFKHDPDKWEPFRSKYLAELDNKDELVGLLKRKARHGKITLIYAARDQEHNGAVVLKEYLEKK